MPADKRTKIKVKGGVQVNKSPREVMSFVQNVDNFPVWQNTLYKVETKAGVAQGELRRNASVRDRRNVLGKEIESQYTVTDLEEGKRLTLEITEGPIYWTMTFAAEAVDGGTFLSAEGGGDLGELPLSENAAARSCQRMLETDLHTLRDAIEGR